MTQVDPERERRFVDEARMIVDAASKMGITLRLLGATAVKLHCPVHERLFSEMTRALTDIDFVAYGRSNPLMRRFFIGLGYVPDDRVMWMFGRKRHIYYNETKGWQADIFFDMLEMSHTVDFRGRLELDCPTIPLSDLILEKIQIARINPKDVKDVSILLLEHDVTGPGGADREKIDAGHIARVLANDWGFYFTATANLARIRNLLGEWPSLAGEERAWIAGRIDRLLAQIESAPKSARWKMRSAIGTKQKWYREVEEVQR